MKLNKTQTRLWNKALHVLDLYGADSAFNRISARTLREIDAIHQLTAAGYLQKIPGTINSYQVDLHNHYQGKAK